MKMIDTHLHFYDGGFPPGAYEPLGPEQVISVLERKGISGAWISSLSSMVGDPIAGNKKLYDFCKGHMDFFKPFYSFNPNYPLAKMKDEVRRCAEEYGARGFKIHSWLSGCSVSTGEMYELSGICEQYGLPILFHDGTPPYCDPLQIASLGKIHPDLKIILGHAGLCDMHYSAKQAYRQNPNVYLCFCCTPLGDIEDFVREFGSDRMFFGTDFYGIDEFKSYVPNMLDSVLESSISEKDKEAIFSKNAEQFMADIENTRKFVPCR